MNKYSLEYFSAKKISFALVKNNKIIYRSKSQGLKPLIFCAKKHRSLIRGALVYDKVIGFASALILNYIKVKEVLTPTISVSALSFLRKNKIRVKYQKKVNHILNKKRSGLCPMEKLCQGKTALEFIKSF